MVWSSQRAKRSLHSGARCLVTSCPLAHWHTTDWGIHLSFSKWRASLTLSLRMWHCESQLVFSESLLFSFFFFFSFCTVYVHAQIGMWRMLVFVSSPIYGYSCIINLSYCSGISLTCLYSFLELLISISPKGTHNTQLINRFLISLFW